MMGRQFDTYRKVMMSRVTDLSLCFHDTKEYRQSSNSKQWTQTYR